MSSVNNQIKIIDLAIPIVSERTVILQVVEALYHSGAVKRHVAFKLTEVQTKKKKISLLNEGGANCASSAIWGRTASEGGRNGSSRVHSFNSLQKSNLLQHLASNMSCGVWQENRSRGFYRCPTKRPNFISKICWLSEAISRIHRRPTTELLSPGRPPPPPPLHRAGI